MTTSDPQAEEDKKAAVVALVLGLLAGAILDFLIYGVAKVIWAVIYVPLYSAAGSALHSQMSRTRWPRQFRTVYLALLAGAILARLTFVNHHRLATYTMTTSPTPPFTLRSPLWPRVLIVSSERLAQNLAGKPAGREIEVKVDVVSDYGCFTSFLVNSVDGVDVMGDPLASWTWKADTAAGSRAGGPGLEDQELPWCRIHFYRTSP